MNRYFILLILVIGSIWGINEALENGSYRRFLDQHASPVFSPPLYYYTGVTYGLFQNLQEAATYYTRVTERFPQSEYADDAYYEYLVSLDERMALPRKDLADEFDKYLEKYPKGKHFAVVQNRSSSLRSGY